MSIPLVERRRYVDDDGVEVIEYETYTQRNDREVAAALQQAAIDNLIRQINEFNLRMASPASPFAGQGCCCCQTQERERDNK